MRIGRAALLIALSVVWISACLRTIDTPEHWPCATNADCEDGNVCRELDGELRCMPAEDCTSDTQCSELAVCRNHGCVAVQCTLDQQASCSPYVCASNICLSRCRSNADCATSFSCEAESCVPTQ
ncbi:MAG TPA: hypothetical protein VER96_28290 [Polyangiaceae bacterium]|nr:hypothetical protein [Polyangiaceae bacterium]